MFEEQQKIELKYSKKHIKEVVLDSIDTNDPIILGLIRSVDEYRNTIYSYESKNKRIKEIRVPSLKLVLDLIVVILTLDADITPIQVVISRLINTVKYPKVTDAVKTLAEVIAICEGELYSIHHSSETINDTDTLGIRPNFEVNDKVREFINNTKYLPPMICKPRFWRNNYEGGYLTVNESVVLGSINNTLRKQNLSTINNLQEIAWSINRDVLDFVEESKKALDTSEKKANFLKLVEDSEKVYSDLLDQGNKFYFVWKYDFRGRSYSQGYHVNPQGNSYRKALIEFHNKELLTEEIVK